MWNIKLALSSILASAIVHLMAPALLTHAADHILLARDPSLCLGIRNDNTLRGNPIVLKQCESNDTRTYPLAWQLVNNVISLRGDARMCIHKHNRGFENGNALHLWECSAGTSEMKEWRYDRDTSYIRSNINPSKCLHMKNVERLAGNAVHVWDCDAGLEEMKRWRLSPARPWLNHTDDTSTFQRLRSSYSNYCLASDRATAADGSLVETRNCPNLRTLRDERDLAWAYSWQLFRVPGRSPYYWLKSYDSNLCLNVHRGRHDYDGAPATLFSCDPTPDQYWEKIEHRDYFQLRNVSTGRCLNARSNSSTSSPHMYDCGNNWRDMRWTTEQLFPRPRTPREEPEPEPPRSPFCSDGRDNDFDGLVDFPDDPGCASANDDSEVNSAPVGYSQLSLTNCTTQRLSINFWRRNVTTRSDWERIDSLPHQYNASGTCPNRTSEYVTINFPEENHLYEIRAVAPSAQSCGGRDDPDYAACIRYSGVFRSNSSGTVGRSFVQ